MNDQWYGQTQAISERDAVMMRLAITQAKMAEQAGEVPVGAVLAREDEVLGVGYNQPIGANDPTAHAEIVALRNAARSEGNYRLPGTTLYVTLEPCAMCAGLMVNARVPRCVYAATDPRGGFLGTLGDLSSHPVLNHRFEVTAGVRAEEAADLLRSFFRRIRAKK